jgi:hypothetical protein
MSTCSSNAVTWLKINILAHEYPANRYYSTSMAIQLPVPRDPKYLLLPLRQGRSLRNTPFSLLHILVHGLLGLHRIMHLVIIVFVFSFGIEHLDIVFSVVFEDNRSVPALKLIVVVVKLEI